MKSTLQAQLLKAEVHRAVLLDELRDAPDEQLDAIETSIQCWTDTITYIQKLLQEEFSQ